MARPSLSRALAILTAAAPAGAIIGVLIGGYVTQYYGWRYAFFIVGLPGLLIAALVYFTVREPERGRLSDAPMRQDRPPFLDTVRRLFTDRVFLFVALGHALAVMMAYIAANWAPPLASATPWVEPAPRCGIASTVPRTSRPEPPEPGAWRVRFDRQFWLRVRGSSASSHRWVVVTCERQVAEIVADAR